MLSKKTVPVIALVLLAAAAAIVGVSQAARSQVPQTRIIVAPGANVGGDKQARVVPPAPALSPATGAVAFSDSFDTQDLSAWQNLPDEEGSWRVSEGRLEQFGNAEENIEYNPATLITKAAVFGDGVFEAQIAPTSGEPVGVMFRGSDAGYYRLSLFPKQPSKAPYARLDKLTPGGGTLLASSKTYKGYTKSQWATVRVAAQGSQISVSVDGETLFEVNDGSLSAGWVGVWAYADRGALFDNVRVQRDVAGR